jgi:hypothetical protein
MSVSPSNSDVVLPEWIAARAAAQRARLERGHAVPVPRRGDTSPESDSDSDSKSASRPCSAFQYTKSLKCRTSPCAYAFKRLGSAFDNTSIAYLFLLPWVNSS